MPTVSINKVTDLSLVQLLFGGLVFIGLIIKWLSGMLPPNSSIGEATGTIWGYSVVLFSLLGLVIIRLDSNNSPNKQLLNVPYTIYILSVIVLWIIVINIKYKSDINKKSIPPTYTFWNTWSTIFIGIITFLIVFQYYASVSKIDSYLKTELFSDKNTKIMNVYLGFILFLNLLITSIQTTILQNFRVDG